MWTSRLTGKYSYKDRCQKYDSLKLKIGASSNEDEKLDLLEIHDSHLNSAKQARKSLSDDIQKANDKPSEYDECTFDLQKALSYPKTFCFCSLL